MRGGRRGGLGSSRPASAERDGGDIGPVRVAGTWWRHVPAGRSAVGSHSSRAASVGSAGRLSRGSTWRRTRRPPGRSGIAGWPRPAWLRRWPAARPLAIRGGPAARRGPVEARCAGPDGTGAIAPDQASGRPIGRSASAVCRRGGAPVPSAAPAGRAGAVRVRTATGMAGVTAVGPPVRVADPPVVPAGLRTQPAKGAGRGGDRRRLHRAAGGARRATRAETACAGRAAIAVRRGGGGAGRRGEGHRGPRIREPHSSATAARHALPRGSAAGAMSNRREAVWPELMPGALCGGPGSDPSTNTSSPEVVLRADLNASRRHRWEKQDRSARLGGSASGRRARHRRAPVKGRRAVRNAKRAAIAVAAVVAVLWVVAHLVQGVARGRADRVRRPAHAGVVMTARIGEVRAAAAVGRAVRARAAAGWRAGAIGCGTCRVSRRSRRWRAGTAWSVRVPPGRDGATGYRLR